MTANVSLTLQNNDDARPIIDAVEADNPNATINRMPSLVIIEVPEKLVVNQSSVEERLGRPWDVQELHLSLVSLSGEVDEEDEYFILQWNR